MARPVRRVKRSRAPPEGLRGGIGLLHAMTADSPDMPGRRWRVVHLTSVHPHDDTRIFHKECRSLAEAGFDVVLVAPGAPVAPAGGVRFHPIPRPAGRLRRFATSGLAVFRAALAERGALYHFHDPELIPVGLLLRLCGKRVVYDVHEDVPAQLRSKHWLPSWLRGAVAGLAAAVQWLGLRAFHGVVAAGDDVAEALGREGVTVVRNFPLLREFPLADTTDYASRAPVVVHVGNLSRIRASRELVEAMGHLPAGSPARLVLVGRFTADGLEAEVRELPGWARTDFQGWGDRATVAARLAEARVGVVMFGPHPNHYAVRSNKLFEYMAAGLPVVTPDFPAWRELVEGTGCGLVADPTDPAAIASALATLLEDPARARAMGARGREAVLATYNWEAEFARLRSLYERLLGPGMSGSPA